MNVLNSKAGMIGAGVLVAGVVVYFLGRQIAKGAGDAAGAVLDAVGGAVTGNNALTQGTPYEGVGFGLGTLGAATNAASGGVLGRFGSWLGGQIYDIANKPYDPNQRAFSAAGPVRPEDKPSSLRF